MSRVPGWLGRLGAGLTEMSERLDERRAEVEKDRTGPADSAAPEPAVAPAEAAPPVRR
ncbi:AI-2E family transporter, partial [Streptomyces sp. SID486]|nr:AI-2E family transporter [Streptomyces sp. SID486]